MVGEIDFTPWDITGMTGGGGAISPAGSGGGAGGFVYPLTFTGGTSNVNVLWQNTSSNATYASASNALKVT